MTANQNFVNNLYEELLSRPADTMGLGYYSGQLDKGVGRDQIVAQIMGGDEYHADVVQQLYQMYLHRDADPNGLTNYVGFLDHGGTVEQLRAILLGSDEYYFGHGASNGNFLAALYHDVLGRPIDASGQSIYSQMLAGGASRSDIAAALLQSAEGSQYRVNQEYLLLLRRSADAAGLSAYSSQLAASGQEEAVVVTLLSSDEFYGRS
jgi:hypothetical protein